MRATDDGPYGDETLMRDNSGDWMVLVEPRDYAPEEIRRSDFE